MSSKRQTISGPTRRQFLKAATVAAIVQGCSLVRPSLARAASASRESSFGTTAIDAGWEHYRGPLDGPWEAWRGNEIAVWEKVALPHCFNSYDACDPDTPYYRGQGWYRTHLPAEQTANGARTLLDFEGAGQTCEVYLGSRRVFRHVGGYDEFMVDITGALAAEPTETRLAVMCDNSPDLERSPSDLSDFCLYGGLYRHVHLVRAPQISLESVRIEPEYTPGATEAGARIRVRIYNPENRTGSVRLSIEVTGPEGECVFAMARELPSWSGEREVAQFPIPHPAPWSPAKPALYRCAVRLSTSSGDSALTERFGLRYAEFVERGPFLLNGERLLLRGTQRHMDSSGYAAAQPDESIREEFRLAKEMGVNFIRLAHYPQTKLVLDLCDELGILVWEETTWCRSGVGNGKWRQQVAATLANMIDRHGNHPSVLMWGLGNEDDWPNEYPAEDKAAIRAYLTDLNNLAHRLDPSRPTAMRRCDFARDIPDIYSPSIWAGWYRGLYTDYRKSLETERDRVKRMIHIEWGADSHARRHAENPYAAIGGIASGGGVTDERKGDYLLTNGDPRVSRDGDWSESYACDLFDWHLKVQETLPWLAGSAQWALKDFPTPLRAENPVPRVNQKGVLERDLTPKEGYYVFQSYWSEKPMAHIYGHSWPVRWGAEGEARMVKVYSNCASVELFVNSQSAGVRQRNSQDFPAAGLRWMVKFASGKNHLRVVAAKNGVTVSDEIECEYEARRWSIPEHLTLREVERGDGRATVEASVFDAQGVPCLDCRSGVRFSVAGDAKLIDNLGASAGSRVVQMYNGRARISIARRGVCVAAAVVAGLAPATLALT
ncbi:MAG: glycoside hydrolase family 2 TIM barrel-domain containing protein [Terracidiphilus sp.]|nr:glycoside hydrolase family 2 TIM barrel-domain containing protein [Terracidiphilus sp.]